jgi:hypothetical protein
VASAVAPHDIKHQQQYRCSVVIDVAEVEEIADSKAGRLDDIVSE